MAGTNGLDWRLDIGRTRSLDIVGMPLLNHHVTTLGPTLLAGTDILYINHLISDSLRRYLESPGGRVALTSSLASTKAFTTRRWRFLRCLGRGDECYRIVAAGTILAGPPITLETDRGPRRQPTPRSC